jgi:RNA polymerase sigma factor (TIGR02999 family)
VDVQETTRLSSNSADRWIDEVYREVRASAAAMLAAERVDHTLQPTALVHEAYLRLSRSRAGWPSAAAFKAAAAVTLRRVLVDHARGKRARKRGGSHNQAALPTDLKSVGLGIADLLAIDEAIGDLRDANERHATIVELRCFGGMTMDEIAGFLGVSTRTIDTDWRMARAWLRDRLGAAS